MAFDYRTSTGLGETETPGGYKQNQMHTRTQGRGALTPQGTEPGPPVSVQVPAQARVALRNQDFVLEADNVQFRNGNTVFVNSSTNFISVKGNRAVVQISPSNYYSGPNGLGGVTVDGYVSELQVKTDSKGRITYSMNVTGIGINAQVEIYMYPNSSQATATVYPNFNSNTVWLQGTIVPYENSNVIEGNSL